MGLDVGFGPCYYLLGVEHPNPSVNIQTHLESIILQARHLNNKDFFSFLFLDSANLKSSDLSLDWAS